MRLSEQVKPISYLKDNTARVVTELAQTRTPLIITQNGEPTFVVQDIKSFEQTRETMALLKILALGKQQIEQGKFQDADDAFQSLDQEFLE